jgi:hypothetical protein
MRRIYDDSQTAQTVLGLGDCSTKSPHRASESRQFSVRTIPQCDFNGLKRYAVVKLRQAPVDGPRKTAAA